MKNLYLLKTFGFRYIMQSIFIYFGVVYSHLNTHSYVLIGILILISLLRYKYLLSTVKKNAYDFIEKKNSYPKSKIKKKYI